MLVGKLQDKMTDCDPKGNNTAMLPYYTAVQNLALPCQS